ncbi:hypothetical protein AAL_00056 [Moelleriella libera RCEF 2490]|uniref:Uncharacterized protein n=1 Tax=Moelleriella libera RCEF 2490 TaxID=1081109 RepID=A0A166UIV7_9HYPO|nr:hypothetical protein AAL_00056 [Moelleriella libera RCEF 2490]
MLSLVLLSALATSHVLATPLLQTRDTCEATSNRVCYGTEAGSSQGIDVTDVQLAADYLRFRASLNESEPQYLTMGRGPTCVEELVPGPGGGGLTVVAKHIDPSVESSVLLTDIADAIDGGEMASPDERERALIGCAEKGGQGGIKIDPNNPAYNTREYKSRNATPGGIIVKLVRS